MKLSMYQIDAFAGQVFEGNPAAVIPLDEWLPDELMQNLAMENNLSETVFFVPTDSGFHIRWFTPEAEVSLCGHATLAAAWVIFNRLDYGLTVIEFESLSGRLEVGRDGDLLVMNFPAQPPVESQEESVQEALIEALGIAPTQVLEKEDYIAVYETEEEVRRILPDQRRLARMDLRGVIITAPLPEASEHNFVVRFFAPKYGVPEDPVTGSAYTQLVPYWANRTGLSKLKARQLSRRGGDVFCELKGERVVIAGTAVEFMQGEIDIPG